MQPFSLPDRYRLEGGIAAGGMAAVYAAHDTVLNRPVAVKVLADHLNDDLVARARFEREGRAAAGLSNHPGVVTIFDVGEHNGRAYIVMERREGGTIGDAGPVDHERALRWLSTIADAVDAAHEAGVVHRDIKPGNLLLDDRDHVAVADFGIASLAHETERFTMTGQVLGTAAYLSPEQAMGEDATPASDRYSLAVVAYELLTGEKPYRTSNFAAQARAHIEEPIPAAPGLPSAAQDVLRRGLAKSPEERWPTSRAMVDALRAALSDTTRVLPPQPPSPQRRGLGPALIAAAALLVVIAIAAIALSGGEDEPTEPTKAKKPRAEETKTAAPEPEETEAAPEETEAPPEETPVAEETEAPPSQSSGDASALNAEGFSLYQAGDYEGAIEPLTGAVEACGDSSDLDPCGYAIYNLGSSLHRAGRSAEAIPYLERRLNGWNFKQGIVRKELEAAQAAAG